MLLELETADLACKIDIKVCLLLHVNCGCNQWCCSFGGENTRNTVLTDHDRSKQSELLPAFHHDPKVIQTKYLPGF